MSYSSSHLATAGTLDRYPEGRLFCRLDGLPSAERSEHRLSTLKNLGLLDADSISVFEEAAQLAANFLKAPICLYSIADTSHELFKAAVGLSRLGLMNTLATERQLPLQDGFSVYVLDSEQNLVVTDTALHPALAESPLTQHFGIRAYAGVPLMTSDRVCVGVLSVLDCNSREFSQQDIAFLELVARWSMSEHERSYSQTQEKQHPPSCELANATSADPSASSSDLKSLINAVRLSLVGQLTQELRSPLTSVMGMASMLSREIYGPLTEKQREYTGIIRSCSQTLITLLDEIIELGVFEEGPQPLLPLPVDIEMLGQQILGTLSPVAAKWNQQIQLTIEPGPRIWMLDKGKVKPLLYHLIFSLLQMAGEGSTVRIHASRREDSLQWAVWLSNPWIGEGLPQTAMQLTQAFHWQNAPSSSGWANETFSSSSLADSTPVKEPGLQSCPSEHTRELLGLLLSRHLAELHGGTVGIQGSPGAGYRFVVSLPMLPSMNPSIASLV